ncbi:hypothetical protein BGW36DRAFT_360887 [Talaromyces proteolyticus]|uniref:RGS domain-containing protein n=1 Tax=Talaromyces proteolyticus TaxID=1131652 RepID=A0AAD4KST2_9EURO|nr:uncharacterized protein BGW36DRAFT_360887 [Talaromyces proteolyticus]KAH8695180.1 hypothetical protein BGW36DRAFT_360887 [Talaromyces proteolyticus]
MSHRKWPSSLFHRKSRKTPQPEHNLTRHPGRDEINLTSAAEGPIQPSTPFKELQIPLPAGAYSRDAFMHALTHEFDQFFIFTRDVTISGETVLFLRLIQCWKAAWSHLPVNCSRHGAAAHSQSQLFRKIFAVAVEMYYDFINPTTALTAPLNLDYGLANALENVLGDAADTISAGVELKGVVVAPFANPGTEAFDAYQTLLSVWWDLIKSDQGHADGVESSQGNQYSDGGVGNARQGNGSIPSSRLLSMQTRVSGTAVIPTMFDMDIFNSIEDNLALLVFREIFPRYVTWRESRDRQDDETISAAGGVDSLRGKLFKKLSRHS